MRNVVIFLLLAFATAQGDTASSAGVLTLEQAVTMALQQNRDVQSAALEVGKAETLRRANQTSRLPSLQAGVTEADAFRGIRIPVIAVSAHDDANTRERARELGAAAFFRKPVDGEVLIDAIKWAMGGARNKSGAR
jgi:CheY-like chemotaxis protein